ncbi:MAG: hypothetical protein R2730_01355 [Chitinophagales bacterium]
MAKYKKNKPPKKVEKKTIKRLSEQNDVPFFERLNQFLSKRSIVFIAISVLLCLLVSLLLFDLKVSIGGDDSSYISRAYNFIHKGQFPTFQGPIYPILLSIPIALFGIKITLLKLLSLVFILIHLILFNKALEKIVPPIVRIITIFLIAINGYIAFFASSTYNEAFFLMLQSIFFLYFVNHFVVAEDHDQDNIAIGSMVMLGFIMFIMAQTRFISIGAVAAVMIYFLIYKQWKRAGLSTGIFAVFYVGFSLITKFVIKAKGAGMSSQMETLLLKHPYKPEEGTEDVMGFFMRIVDNSNLYLGRTFLVESGFRPITGATLNGSLTLLVYAILIGGFIYAIRNKEKGVIFSYLYAGSLSILTFVVLQKYWDQNRMIIIMYPFLWMFAFYLLYQIFNSKFLKGFQPIFLIVSALLILPGVGRTFTKIGDHSTTLRKNLSGDKLYGFTDDWVNYIKTVQWAHENLEDYYIICRKPQIAFIYTEGTIHKGTGLKETDPKKALEHLKENGVTHIVRASLRRNPAVNSGQVINTVHNYMARIEQAYPGTFKVVHAEGKTEPAYLFEINYYGIEQPNN